MVKEQFKALTLPEKYGILIMQKQYACNKDKMQLRTAILKGMAPEYGGRPKGRLTESITGTECGGLPQKALLVNKLQRLTPLVIVLTDTTAVLTRRYAAARTVVVRNRTKETATHKPF